MKATFAPAFVQKTPFRVLVGLLLLLPPLAYLLFVALTHVGMPYRDDYVWYFQFLHDYDHAPNWGERIRVLLAQHDQHRISPLHVTTVLVTNLTGQLDIRLLNFIGNTTLVTLWVFWLWRARRAGLPLWSLVPIGFLWFQPQHWLNPVCSALANLPVIPLLGFSVYALNRPGRSAFAWAVFWAYLATFSYGNGMFIFAVGALIPLLNGQPRRLLLWLALGVLAGYAYFTFGGFYFSGHAGDTRVLPKLLSGPHKVLIYVWTYLGSFVMYERSLPGSIAALVVGILMTVPFALSLRLTVVPPLRTLWTQRTWAALRALPDSPRLALLRELQVLFTFVLITAATVYVFRSDMAAFPDLPIADYYKIWSVFACALALLMGYLLGQPTVGWSAVVLGLSGFFWITTYYAYADIVLHIRQSLRAEALNWHLNRRWMLYGPIGMFDNAWANRYTNDLVSRDRYQVPADDLVPLRHLLAQPNPDTLRLALTATHQPDGYWMQPTGVQPTGVQPTGVQPTGALPAPLVGNAQAYLVLQQGTTTVVLPMLPAKNSWKRVLTTRRWHAPVATITLPDPTWRDQMRPGPYTLRVVSLGSEPQVWQLPYRWNVAGAASGFVPNEPPRPGS
jgi:hypothetical protein